MRANVRESVMGVSKRKAFPLFVKTSPLEGKRPYSFDECHDVCTQAFSEIFTSSRSLEILMVLFVGWADSCVCVIPYCVSKYVFKSPTMSEITSLKLFDNASTILTA